MLKKCKVVMLSSNKNDSKIGLNLNAVTGKHLYYFDQGARWDETQHLYFLSDDEIKKDDWVIMLDSFGNVFSNPQQYINPETQHLNKGLRKIIATTNLSIILPEKFPSFTTLPQPSKSFIQKYIESYNKGNIIDSVNVEYSGEYDPHYGGYYAETIELKVNQKDNTITIKPIKNNWSKEEVNLLIKNFCIDNNIDIKSYEINNWIEKNL
jgi:hypothetical protein